MDIFNADTRHHLLVRPDDMLVIDISTNETIDIRGDELIKALLMVKRQQSLALEEK